MADGRRPQTVTTRVQFFDTGGESGQMLNVVVIDEKIREGGERGDDGDGPQRVVTQTK